ncbi:MAG: hypothetical protein CL531_03760 [Aestuariibacter sp.]|nr:hypothetical protein [Aestuariibacter sp.]
MIRFYEHRWFIEECNKVRTTEGTDIEIARSESMDNIEQPVIISVFYCYKDRATEAYSQTTLKSQPRRTRKKP